MEIGDDGPTRWVAAPRMDVHVGDRVAYVDAVEVADFHSETLGRTFERMLLAMYVFKMDARGMVVPANPHASATTRSGPSSALDHLPSPIVLAPKNAAPASVSRSVCTVAEVVSQVESLAGQDLIIRGVVASATYDVRPAPGQPPLNWYRLRDELGGRGEAMAVCGDVVLKHGETVVIQGKLAVNKRFDVHVHYAAIVESARKVPSFGPQL